MLLLLSRRGSGNDGWYGRRFHLVVIFKFHIREAGSCNGRRRGGFIVFLSYFHLFSFHIRSAPLEQVAVMTGGVDDLLSGSTEEFNLHPLLASLMMMMVEDDDDDDDNDDGGGWRRIIQFNSPTISHPEKNGPGKKL